MMLHKRLPPKCPLSVVLQSSVFFCRSEPPGKFYSGGWEPPKISPTSRKISNLQNFFLNLHFFRGLQDFYVNLCFFSLIFELFVWFFDHLRIEKYDTDIQKSKIFALRALAPSPVTEITRDIVFVVLVEGWFLMIFARGANFFEGFSPEGRKHFLEVQPKRKKTLSGTHRSRTTASAFQ